MKKINFSTSACRFCRFYEPEGRRGGSCQMLGVPVESSWKACNFASPPFETTLEKLENILQLETSIALDSPERVIPQKVDAKIDAKVEGNHPKMAAPKQE
ncbi:MAG: hypothetical protein HC930_03625 [Hydrococcus sp. SU_1_0]|nr:hypothetical protein [Hydrococcus sp. SU_1_0]